MSQSVDEHLHGTPSESQLHGWLSRSITIMIGWGNEDGFTDGCPGPSKPTPKNIRIPRDRSTFSEGVWGGLGGSRCLLRRYLDR